MTAGQPDPFDPAAAAGFAAVLLEATRDAMGAEPTSVPDAIANLASITGVPLDLAAGLLLATTSLLAGVEVDPNHVGAIADNYRRQAEQEAAEQ